MRLLTELNVKASTHSVENPRIKKKERVFRTKKERKELRERKKIEKDLGEANAQVSFEEKEQVQSDTLKIVFTLYFQILKDVSNAAMLTVVLDGIATFSRLINADFFGDLLEVIKEIMERWEDTFVRQKLVCLHTAFTLLANQGDSKVDLWYFVQKFYDLLPYISASTELFDCPSKEEQSLMALTVRIVDEILFNPPTSPSPSRILMFYKRLLTSAVQMDEKDGTVFLRLAQRIGSRFAKRVEGMWYPEGSVMGDEASGKEARAWEVALLDKHYGKGVVQIIRTLGKPEEKGL